ncbi:hypothetical protein [Saccharothrix texasensis]|uniref:Serine/threonine protein kinase n=1 Tax=Saccharothrix texasensis TaxID=103734 RepID=A0A3N1HHY9_9PSEU|nr:hypothetical protein [Saccharothrix texasensis]ROP41922.1 hypothetical protein EDD40_7408 [Saccharothrix texasensis]
MHKAAWVAVAMVLLAAVGIFAARIDWQAESGTQVASSERTQEEATTPEDPSPPRDAAPDAATEVINVVAARAGVPVDGYTAGRPGAPIDSCFPSAAGVTADIVSCGTTAHNADVCWLAPDRVGLLCGTDPWEKELLAYTTAQPVTRAPATSTPRPWALELADGSRCRMRTGGSWPGRADGYVGAYRCTGPTEFVLSKSDAQVDRSTATWTVMTGGLSADNRTLPPPTPITVVTAYFASV